MDPYVYPGTDILRNRRGIRDDDQLGEFEALFSQRRIAELIERPIPGKFNQAHLKAIHRHIFQDIYDWAGEFRTVDIARPGQFYFAFVHQIANVLEDHFGKLARESHLQGSSLEHFSTRAAYYMGELNAVHPFRDGNGRTQREFMRELGWRPDSLCAGRALLASR